MFVRVKLMGMLRILPHFLNVIDSESLILTIPSPYGLLYAIKKAFPVYSKNCCDILRRNGALVFAYE